MSVPASDSQLQVPLFHPRQDRWSDHFYWDGYRIVGRTATGRGTIEALELNHARRLQIRQAEESFKLFPPAEDVVP